MPEIISEATNYLNILFSQFFTKFIVAVIILLIGFVIARIIGRLISKVLHEIELNNILKKAGVKFQLEDMLSHAATYFIYFITVVWALNALGLTTTILNMISAAVLILIIVAIFLGIKDFFPNIISGFFIHRKNIIKIGDKIKVDNLTGKVTKITLIETEIKTSSGDTIYIPNSIITKKEITVKKR